MLCSVHFWPSFTRQKEFFKDGIRYLLETAVKCHFTAPAVVCWQLGENRFSAAGPVAQAGTKMIVAVSKEVFKNIFECSY